MKLASWWRLATFSWRITSQKHELFPYKTKYLTVLLILADFCARYPVLMPFGCSWTEFPYSFPTYIFPRVFCFRRNLSVSFSASYTYRKTCPLGFFSSQMPQFASDDQFIWVLYVRRDTIVKSRVAVVCNEFLDESPDTCKAPLPPPSQCFRHLRKN